MAIDMDPPAADPVDLTSYVRGAKGATTLGVNIGIGATYTVTVTFDRTLPNTNYGVIVSIEGATLLGDLLAQPLSGTKTTTTVQVAVKNTGLIALGLNATITAFAVYT